MELSKKRKNRDDDNKVDMVLVGDNSLDAMGAATVVRLFSEHIKCVFIKNEQSFKFLDSIQDKDIVMFGIEPSRDALKEFCEKCNSVQVFTHHQSFSEIARDWTLNCWINTKTSAVATAWAFFFPSANKVPSWISYIQDDELKTNIHVPRTLQFVTFLQWIPRRTPTDWMFKLYRQTFKDLEEKQIEFKDAPHYWDGDDELAFLEIGANIVRVQQTQALKISKRAKETSFHGIPCAIINYTDNWNFGREIWSTILLTHPNVKMAILWKMDINDNYQISVHSNRFDKSTSCILTCSSFGAKGDDHCVTFELDGHQVNLVEFFEKNL